ncbi:MAG: sugar kinase [bacterium]
MKSTKNIVGFGEVMLRLAPEGHLRLLQSLPGSIKATFGGGEANVCASLALLGETSRYVTAIPDNPVSEAFIFQLRGLGVDTSKILLKKSGRFGIYYVEAGANQRPSNVVYDREYSAISQTAPGDYDWDSILENTKWLHLSGITPALSEKAFLSTLAIAEKAQEKKITVSCDLNFRKKLWKWDPSKTANQLANDCMSRIVKYVDVIVGNEEDALDVFGINAGHSSVDKGLVDVKSYEEVAEKMAREFPQAKYIAITLRESVSASHNNWGAMLYATGSRRAFFAPLDSALAYAPYQITDIVDRVGGGDSFSAGLIYALNSADLQEPEKAIAFATAASCLKHSIAGDYNFVQLKEVMTLMQGNASGRVVR